MNRLAGRTALITGGGSGIGLAVARGFLSEGARVTITGRREEQLRQAADSLAAGESLFCQAADVADPGQVRRLNAAVTDRFGPVDILVNNAGVNIPGRRFGELTPESWQIVLRTNLDGAFYCTREVVPGMRERGGGLILFIDSVAGLRASPLGGTAYSASKFGMRALALCMGAEEEPNGIRVSVLYPGEVNTAILDARPESVSPERRRAMLQPEDVAVAALFVATLPARVTVPELVIKPAGQIYV